MKELQQGAPFTGDSSKRREMWDSTSVYPNDDAGAPRLATVNQASIDQQFDPFSQGYEETVDAQATVESPTLFVTIEYSPSFGGKRSVRVPWEAGMSVMRAIRVGKRIDRVFHGVSSMGHARVVNKRRVKYRDKLNAGDVLKLNSRERPFA